MDSRSITTPSHGKAYRHGPAASSYLCLSDLEQKPCHSTPVTKSNDIMPGGSQILTPDSRYYGPHISTAPFLIPSLQDAQFPVAVTKDPMIKKLKKELQLLVTELKDRDKELNDMAAAHCQEVQAWEKMRQKLLKLERQCACLEDELQKHNNVIRILTKHVVVLETREEDALEQLRETQLQLRKLSNKELNLSKKCQDFEEQNKSLNASVTALSTQIGTMQVREEELSSMLKLKEKDVSEASSQLVDLTGHLKDMEISLKESYSKESTLQTELQEQKHYYTEACCAITQLKEQLQQQIAQSSAQREEIIRLKQELQLVSQNQALQDEGGSSWKDELLELFRSKQERAMSELLCLRQLNLESARHSLKERVTWEIPSSQDYVNRRSMDLNVLCNCSLKKILKELDETSSEHSSCRQPRQKSTSFMHKQCESPPPGHHHGT
ncbi:coiled-coil domain-containing protein 62 isoform X2 [Boleophthalmus pectinirostris]|uniref:coiled-coil domain-containing protein 62 isoform X2 n=1 Tax=Boleophthalmus pectinirostris TaxID=150288 RepID=UPI000A1C3805|nr:coiled-coil domain-containing protein 62 isoform X2 [Boleophthalmus pectinirostris]